MVYVQMKVLIMVLIVWALQAESFPPYPCPGALSCGLEGWECPYPRVVIGRELVY